MENLSIKDGMLQDKKHGKHNKQKRSRNKLIVDAAMGMLRIKLQQKCKSKGINFIKIERYFLLRRLATVVEKYLKVYS